MPQKLAIRGTFYRRTFLMKINSDGPFHIPENWPLLTMASRTFSLSESHCVSTLWAVFLIQAGCRKPVFSPFINFFFFFFFFFTITCFSVHISHSENFKWFALFSHQKFDDRPLSNLEKFVWFAAILNSFKRNIFARLNCEILALNQFQTMQSLHL